MNAHRELHEEYPDQDPSWSMADECKVFVFPAPASEEVLHNLRIVGAAQNKCEEVRHKKDFKDAVAHFQRAYNRNIRKKGNPQARFDSADKVLFYCCHKIIFILLWFHKTFFFNSLFQIALAYQCGYSNTGSLDSLFQMVQQPPEIYDLCWVVVDGKQVPKSNTDFVAPTSQETFKYMTRSLTKKEKISLLSRMISGEILVKDFPSKCQHITRSKKLQNLLIDNLGEADWELAQKHYPILATDEDLILQWIVSYNKEFTKMLCPKAGQTLWS